MVVTKKIKGFFYETNIYHDIEYSKNDLAFGTFTCEMVMQSYIYIIYIRNLSYYIRNLFSLTAFQNHSIFLCNPEERMYKENIASTKSRL